MNTKSPIAAQLSELTDLVHKVDTLKNEIEETRTSELRALHTNFGYETPADFLSAYHVALDVRGAKKNSKKAKAKVNGKAKPAARKARVTITPEQREEIKKFFRNDGTVMEAITKFDISVATAQNIKKEAGMVNARHG